VAWWYVTGSVTVTATGYVEADTKEQAIAKARDREIVLDSGPQSGHNPTEELGVEEADGILFEVRVSPVDRALVAEHLNDEDDDTDS
jgi:hypothetical protein